MNPYLQDLSAGSCYGDMAFTERPQEERYAACKECPVNALCPSRTKRPKAPNGEGRKPRQKKPGSTASWDEVVAALDRYQENGSYVWHFILDVLNTTAPALRRRLYRRGMHNVARSLSSHPAMREQVRVKNEAYKAKVKAA